MNAARPPAPLPRTLAAIPAAAAGGAVAALAAWLVLHSMSLPAFGGSPMTRALATAAVTAVLAATAAALLAAHLRPAMGRAGRAAVALVTHLAPAGLVVAVLGIPLASTRLYLDGVSVDQGFRTEYLTRMAAEPGLHDMAYIDVPPFYPAGWFRLGGWFARAAGLPGWAAFQPWALITFAAAGCLLVPVWRRLTGSPALGAAIALSTTAVALTVAAEEPYAAAVAMGAPAAAVLARRAAYGGRAAAVALTLFLGASATFYTLHTAVAALVAALAAAGAAIRLRRVAPLLRLAGIGAGSLLIAASVWAPYLLARLGGAPASGATAAHYLPEDGARLPLPMLSAGVLGLLCLAGVAWLVLRAADPTARALALATLTLYGWALASMLATLTGRTLLGFRIAAPITITLATAGVLGIAAALSRLPGDTPAGPGESPRPGAPAPRRRRARAATLVTVLALACAVAHAQSIPARLHGPIDLAHTDTDGSGERADRFAPDAGAHYPELDRVLREAGLDPAESVLLTDERNFLAFYPWYSFQAMTSHYANPLGEFDKRNAAIESWTRIADPGEFAAALDGSGWRGPDALILRGDLSDPEAPLTLDLAEDIYPNNPNVLFRGVAFDRGAFAEGWSATQVGPFAVLVRR